MREQTTADVEWRNVILGSFPPAEAIAAAELAQAHGIPDAALVLEHLLQEVELLLLFSKIYYDVVSNSIQC